MSEMAVFVDRFIEAMSDLIGRQDVRITVETLDGAPRWERMALPPPVAKEIGKRLRQITAIDPSAHEQTK